MGSKFSTEFCHGERTTMFGGKRHAGALAVADWTDVAVVVVVGGGYCIGMSRRHGGSCALFVSKILQFERRETR